MLYQSENGHLDFVDTRIKNEAIVLKKETKLNVPYRGKILNIDKDDSLDSNYQAKLFEFKLNSFGYEVTTVSSLQAAAEKISSENYDYYVLDTAKYLGAVKNPIQLISDLHSEAQPGKKMNLITRTTEHKSLAIPKKVNYVARWSKALSLNELMMNLVQLSTGTKARPTKTTTKTNSKTKKKGRSTSRLEVSM